MMVTGVLDHPSAAAPIGNFARSIAAIEFWPTTGRLDPETEIRNPRFGVSSIEQG
jgi:hypothetical protein